MAPDPAAYWLNYCKRSSNKERSQQKLQNSPRQKSLHRTGGQCRKLIVTAVATCQVRYNIRSCCHIIALIFWQSSLGRRKETETDPLTVSLWGWKRRREIKTRTQFSLIQTQGKFRLSLNIKCNTQLSCPVQIENRGSELNKSRKESENNHWKASLSSMSVCTFGSMCSWV